MEEDYAVDLTADVDHLVDGGRVTHLALRHQGQPVLAGLVVEYEDDVALVDDLTVNECVLPSPTARRLLMALYGQYMPLVGQFGDSGLITRLNLHVFLRDHYEDVRERETVLSMVEQALEYVELARKQMRAPSAGELAADVPH